MQSYDPPVKRVASSPLGLALIWLLMSISCIVVIEPAPYDGLIILLTLTFFALGMRIPSKVTVPITLLGMFLLANVISALFIPDPSFDFNKPGHSLLSVPTRIHLAITWLFFVCIIFEDPDRVIPILWKGYLVATFGTVAFGFLLHYGIIHATGGWAEEAKNIGRVKGTFEDANVFGPFIIVGALYLVAKLEDATPAQIFFRLILFAFFTWGVLHSYSRGAWGNFIASIGIYLAMRFYTARSETHQLKVIIFGLSLILAVSGGLTGLIMTGKIESLFFKRAQLLQEYDVREGGRFDTQGKALKHISTDPLGVGPGQASYQLGLSPHNLYLIVPLETGWLGFLGLFSFVSLTLWRGFHFCIQPTRFQHLYTVIFACTLATMLESVVIDSTHWRHMYFLWAMIWGPILAMEASRKQSSTGTSETNSPGNASNQSLNDGA